MEIKTKTIENDLDYLRQISKPVDFKNDEWKEALKTLDEYCKKSNTVMAMASVQLGIPLRMVYLKNTDLEKLEDIMINESRVLINPKVINREGLTRYYEACASCLDNMGLVERPYKIKIEYYDENKKKHIKTFKGFESTVLSHELDHLDGILHIDKSIELYQMKKDERKKFRETHPYKIIRKDGEFIEKQK